MAISFHSDELSSSSNFVKCPVHLGKDGVICIDIDGYLFYLPQARDFIDVLEHLTILQERFNNGLTLVDFTKE